MNKLSRLALLLIMFAGLASPVHASVTAIDAGAACDIFAADEDKKKPEGGEKPKDDEEPECE